jgi:F-type H+-transporting ATPase subunit b
MFLLVFADSIQLFPDGTLFIHIALILLMIWVLNRTFFRPIGRLIESREKHQGGHGAEAESIRRDVTEKQAKYQRELLAARSEGYELIEKQRAVAVDVRTSNLTAAKAETAKTLADGKQRVEQETAEAHAVIAQEADALAEKISSNILKA